MNDPIDIQNPSYLVTPADFEPKAKVWTRGMIEVLAEALGPDRIVLMATVRGSGLLQPVNLLGYRTRYGGHGDIVARYAGGDRHTAFFAPEIGPIVVLGEGNPVRRARDNYRDIARAAVEAIRPEHGWDNRVDVRVTSRDSAHVTVREADPWVRGRIVWHGEVRVDG
jgi:hypothetical protein